MRITNWPSELYKSIHRHGQVFEYGRMDCANFVFKVRNDILGRNDVFWKNNYKTEKGALKQLRKQMGCETASDLVTKCLKQKPQLITLARRGDIVAHVSEEHGAFGEALGICLGERSAFIHAEYGLITLRTRDCSYCWRVD